MPHPHLLPKETHLNKRAFMSLSIAGTAGLLLAVSAPLAASAHVTIDPGTATPGSYTVVTLKVPNESATASTTRVEVALPTDLPFTSVRYVPVPGWSAELVRESLPEPVMVGENELTESVTSVIWTAESGSEIGDGQLQQFDLSLGPVPDTGSIVLPATQGYSDGTVVEWADTADDAEHPAPVLYINDAPSASSHGAAQDASASAAASASAPAPAPALTAAETSATASTSDDVLARVLGIAGLVVGVVGIVLAVTNRRRPVR
jgi:uncharacterized protein YcnI